jgi:hypothetical protein
MHRGHLFSCSGLSFTVLHRKTSACPLKYPAFSRRKFRQFTTQKVFFYEVSKNGQEVSFVDEQSSSSDGSGGSPVSHNTKERVGMAERVLHTEEYVETVRQLEKALRDAMLAGFKKYTTQDGEEKQKAGAVVARDGFVVIIMKVDETGKESSTGKTMVHGSHGEQFALGSTIYKASANITSKK